MTYHGHVLPRSRFAMLSFILQNTRWLGFLMNGFSKRHLAPLDRMAGRSLARTAS
jgi:hypothetical protein